MCLPLPCSLACLWLADGEGLLGSALTVLSLGGPLGRKDGTSFQCRLVVDPITSNSGQGAGLHEMSLGVLLKWDGDANLQSMLDARNGR